MYRNPIWLLASLLVTVAACAGAPERVAEPAHAASLLELIERERTVDASSLPPRTARTAVVFFASWCGACRAHLAELQDVASELPSLRVVLVNAYEDYADRSDEARMRAFLAERGIEWPVVRDRGALREAFGGVPKIPAMFVFDADGRELARYGLPARPVPPRSELRAALGPPPE